MGVAPVFRAAVAPVFAVAVAAVFGAAFGVFGVLAYADTEQAEKAKAEAMMKIDLITFAPISSGNQPNLTIPKPVCKVRCGTVPPQRADHRGLHLSAE